MDGVDNLVVDSCSCGAALGFEHLSREGDYIFCPRCDGHVMSGEKVMNCGLVQAGGGVVGRMVACRPECLVDVSHFSLVGNAKAPTALL